MKTGGCIATGLWRGGVRVSVNKCLPDSSDHVICHKSKLGFWSWHRVETVMCRKNKWKMIAAILNHGCSLTGRATRRWQASRVGALSVWVCLDRMNKLDPSISNLILLPWSNFTTFFNYYLTIFFFYSQVMHLATLSVFLLGEETLKNISYCD